MLQRYCKTLYSSSMAIFCLCIILPLHGFNYHKLAPAFYIHGFICNTYQVSFTSGACMQQIKHQEFINTKQISNFSLECFDNTYSRKRKQGHLHITINLVLMPLAHRTTPNNHTTIHTLSSSSSPPPSLSLYNTPLNQSLS